MKKLIYILIMIVNWQLAIDNCYAQAPNSFSYQAVVRNNSGVAMPNQLVNFRISILQGSANGTPVYSETKQLTTSSGGLADFQVGTGTIVSGTMAAINWGANTHFLKIELDATGGSNFVPMGTSQLMSVPYALDAKKAESLQLPLVVSQDHNHALIDITNTHYTPITTSQTVGIKSRVNNTEMAAIIGISGPPTFGGGGTFGVLGTSNCNDPSFSDTLRGYALGAIGSGNYGNGIFAMCDHFNAKALTTNGGIQFTGIGEHDGYVLTSSGNGTAHWSPPQNVTVNVPGYIGGPGITVLSGVISALDPSPTNEIQTLSLSGNELLLSNGGGTVTLPVSNSTSPFTTNGNNSYQTNVTDGTISLGASAGLPAMKLSITGNTANPNGLYVTPGTNGAAILTGGAVGINTLTPAAGVALDVNGAIKISGGTPANGKVLTSDANGLASWQTPIAVTNYTGGSGINISGGNVISTIPQTISIASNQLTLSNGGGTVTLPSNTYTGGAGIVVAGSTVNALHTTNIWNANKIQGNNVSTTTPTNGQSLVWNNTASQWEPQTISGGGGSSPWTVTGNDINNSNTGKVLVGEATGTTSAKFEVANNPGAGFGKVAAISTTSNYMTALDVTESSTSGNPAATVGSTGATAIKASATFGDALFAHSSNGRGIFLKGGSTNYPAMKIENNVNAITSLEMDGQIKINGGTPGAGKVLTSDANGLATWQTPSGGGGGGATGWGLTGNSGNSATTNFIGNTDAVDLVMKTNNVAGLVLTSGGAILANGNTTTGTTPTIGAGTRMMWIPNRAAFRAGAVNGTQWNDINIGFNSAAFGNNCIASGMNSFAVGSSSSAGSNTAISMGSSCSATSANTVALGNLVSVNQSGSFCFGDQEFANSLMPSTSNEMSMRFKGGYRLFTTSATTGGSAIGVTLVAGGNSWAQISDVRRKENFVPVNGEDFLNKIAQFKLTSWNYKGQDAKSFRHYGPMAQDFYAAFGNDQLGTIGNDTTITSGDFDGINFIAIQALEKRTSDLNNANLKLQQENKMLLESIESMKAEMSSQKAALNKKFEMLEAILENSKVDKNEFITNNK